MDWLRKSFFRYRRDHESWEKSFKRFPNDYFGFQLIRHITSLEKEYGIRLTDSAVEMLLIPLEEQYFSDLHLEFGYDKNQENVIMNSVELLFKEMKENPSDNEKYFMINNDERSSLSVIKAYHLKFCNIPPFCKPINNGNNG
jgi:hypothetical protein